VIDISVDFQSHLIVYMEFYLLLWMLLTILVEVCTDYLFQESELTMVNSYWLIEAQPFGIDCQMHTIVLKH